MSFLYPFFLWALVALLIPIIIHLFNFRRYKKIYFTNVRYLKELKQESESKSRLKHYLILLSRLLALTALVFAFAQPVISGKANGKTKVGRKAISIFIDNSFSMEAVGKTGTLLATAKEKARELANNFSSSDMFQLLTNDFEGKHQRLLSREEFFQQLEEVKISAAFRSADNVFLRQCDLLLSGDFADRKAFQISDFQKNFTDMSREIVVDSSVSLTLVPLYMNEVKGDNVYIDTCWFEQPVQQEGTTQLLHVRLVNSGNKNIENASARLYLQNKLIAPVSFSADAESNQEIVFTFNTKEKGIHNGRIEIDDYPVNFDDKLFFTFDVRKSFNVLLVTGAEQKSNAALRSLFSSDSVFNLVEMSENAIDFIAFAQQDFIVLSGIKKISSGAALELKKFCASGGSLLLFPSTDIDIASINDFIVSCNTNLFGVVDTSNVICDKIEFRQGLLNGVFEKEQLNMDLPYTFNHFRMTRNPSVSEENIFRLMNGQPFLSMYTVGKGKLYLSNTSLDERWTNFIHHALFVPTLYKMTFNSQLPAPIYFTTAENSVVQLRTRPANNDMNFSVEAADSSLKFIPETRNLDNATLLFMHGMATAAGNYSLSFADELIAGLAFNYPRQESELNYYSAMHLKNEVVEKKLKGSKILLSSEKGVKEALADIEGGTKLWKLFIILTLFFFALEIAFIRLLK